MATKGFSLIEVLIAILIIGIIAAVCIPSFCNLQQQAKQASVDAVVAAINTGIQLYGVNSAIKERTPSYPEALDDAIRGRASSQNPFFANVLNPPVTDSQWSKSGLSIYIAPTGEIYSYDVNKSKFAKLSVVSKR